MTTTTKPSEAAMRAEIKEQIESKHRMIREILDKDKTQTPFNNQTLSKLEDEISELADKWRALTKVKEG